jgi:fibronectin type 3 domain-containing protein
MANKALAQSTAIVVSNSKEYPGKIVNVKWVANGIFFDEGVNIYRREEHIPFWTKINDTPILKGNYQVPDSAFLADTLLSDYIDVARETSGNLEGMAKAFFLLEMVYSNEFSKFIGTQYDDSDVLQGKTYRYMVKRIQGESEIFEAVSEPIQVGPFIPISAPKNVRVEAGNKKVNLWWKVEDKKFHSVNVYRTKAENETYVKVNPQPIVLAKRKGPDGKIGYPDIYFTDQSVENDQKYFYKLTGIDFFGRESELSEAVFITPINKKPPPAPKFLDCKVDLFNIELEWSPPEQKRVVGLHIYRSASIYSEFERITTEPLSPLSVRFSDKVDKPGNFYYYVSSVTKHGVEGKSNLTMAQILDIFPPDAPKNLTAKADSGQVTLSWNSVQDDYFEGYRIYRTVDLDNEQFYVLINAEPIKDTVFVDPLPFNARNKFFYRVVALDTALNMSEYSNPASAVLPDVTPPDVPFIKEVKNVEDKGIEIIWLKNLDIDLLGYNLFKDEMITDSTFKSSKVNTSIIGRDKISHTDFMVNKGVQYSYYLQAIDSVGNKSGLSNKIPAIIEIREIAQQVELKNISIQYNSNEKHVELNWQYINNYSGKGVVIFRQDTTGGRMVPVSGLLKDKKFFDTPPAHIKSCRYKITAYSLSGSKWQSPEFIIDINPEKNK